ncbi:MAG: ComEC/Rec2 family competence protein [Clostridia bacterium]|nr:ComEC/Rec2 family competence protein [Clostridia bacterium]
MKTAAQNADISEVKLFNFRPVLFAAVFLCLGIVFGYLQIIDGVSTWWRCSLLVLVLPIILYQNPKKRKRAVWVVLLLIVAFTLGEGAFRIKTHDYLQSRYFEGEVTAVGRVIEKREYEHSIFVILTDVSVDGNDEKGNFIAYLPATFGENVRLSDRILLTAKVETYKTLFDEYGFAANRIRDDIRYRLYSIQDTFVTGHEFDLFLSIRERIVSVIYAGMDETPAAVTVALFTGSVDGMDNALLENVRYGGIAHIFAVSGLHVGALYLFCRKAFKKLGIPKLLDWFLLTAVLLFYAGVCGFSASVVRAVVICLLAHLAKNLWLKVDFLQSLGASAIVVLLISPTSLYEVGFQLSFLACIGLALLSAPIQKALEKCVLTIEKVVKKALRLDRRARPRPRPKNADTAPPSMYERARRAVLSFLSACIGAQLATAPVQMQAFGYLSGWSLLLNCLFVPLVSGVFAAFLLLIIIACLLPTPIAGMLLYVPSVVWSALLLLFETLDFSAFAWTGVTLSGGAFCSYYAGVQFLSDKWNLAKRQKRVLIFASFATFVICIIFGNIL